MRTFEEYLRSRYLREDDMGLAGNLSGSMPSGDSGKFDAATGGAENQKQKEAYTVLFEIARMATRKFPTKALTWFKSLPDDEIQEKVMKLENDGLWNSIKGRGESPQQPQDDGLERISPPSADMDSGGEE